MRNPRKWIRAAYLQKLASLSYNSISIPVYDTYATDEATIPFGGGSVGAYAVVKNQTRGDNTVKNKDNFQTRISLEIVTKFSGSSFDSSGSEIVEDILSSAYSLLFDGLRFSIREFNDFVIIHTKVNEIDVPAMYNETTKLFRVLVIFTHRLEVK